MRICIDAGHNYSDYDTGAVGNGLREQDVTFMIADKLKRLCLSAGIEVTMTRGKITDNVGVSYEDSINRRASVANTTRCNYFISLHCNSSVSKSAHGTEVLVSGLGGQAEKLAGKIANSISNGMGLVNRGVQVDKEYLGYSLGVLRLTDMPAVLVETAFISNSSEAKLLRNETEGFAKAIFEGLKEHLNLKTEEKSMDMEKAKAILKTKAGLAEETINFLLCYKYGDALVTKLAEAMK